VTRRAGVEAIALQIRRVGVSGRAVRESKLEWLAAPGGEVRVDWTNIGNGDGAGLRWVVLDALHRVFSLVGGRGLEIGVLR